jgi:hypothetical protein
MLINSFFILVSFVEIPEALGAEIYYIIIKENIKVI